MGVRSIWQVSKTIDLDEITAERKKKKKRGWGTMEIEKELL